MRIVVHPIEWPRDSNRFQSRTGQTELNTEQFPQTHHISSTKELVCVTPFCADGCGKPSGIQSLSADRSCSVSLLWQSSASILDLSISQNPLGDVPTKADSEPIEGVQSLCCHNCLLHRFPQHHDDPALPTDRWIRVWVFRAPWQPQTSIIIVCQNDAPTVRVYIDCLIIVAPIYKGEVWKTQTKNRLHLFDSSSNKFHDFGQVIFDTPSVYRCQIWYRGLQLHHVEPYWLTGKI